MTPPQAQKFRSLPLAEANGSNGVVSDTVIFYICQTSLIKTHCVLIRHASSQTKWALQRDVATIFPGLVFSSSPGSSIIISLHGYGAGKLGGGGQVPHIWKCIKWWREGGKYTSNVRDTCEEVELASREEVRVPKGKGAGVIQVQPPPQTPPLLPGNSQMQTNFGGQVRNSHRGVHG